MGTARHFKIADLVPRFSPKGASTHVFLNDKDNASMSAGIVYFKDAEVPFKLWYDEAIFCLTSEGTFSIVVEGKENILRPGDMMWLPAGTQVIYRSRGGTSTATWVVTPPDWEARRPT